MSNYIRNLLIDSRDKTNTTGETYCFNLPFGLDGVKSIELMTCNFPMTSYNVNSSNNYLYLNDGSSKIIQLTKGNYDIYDFVPMLEQALNDSSAINFTVTYSLVSMMLTVTGDSNFSFEFSNTTNSIAYLMGFNNVNTTPALTQVAPKCLNLSSPMYFNIIISELGMSTKSTNSRDNGSFTVFNSVNMSEIANYNNNGNYCQRIKVLNDNIQTFTMRITDYNNRDVCFNGADFSMLIRLNYDC